MDTVNTEWKIDPKFKRKRRDNKHRPIRPITDLQSALVYARLFPQIDPDQCSDGVGCSHRIRIPARNKDDYERNQYCYRDIHDDGIHVGDNGDNYLYVWMDVDHEN